MLGRGEKLGCQLWSQGCSSLQGRPNQPSSRPAYFSAGPTKHPKLLEELPPWIFCPQLICTAGKQRQLRVTMFSAFFSPRTRMASFWLTEILLLRIIKSVLYTWSSFSQTLLNLLREDHKWVPQSEQEQSGPKGLSGVLFLWYYWQRWSTTEAHSVSHWGQILIFVSDDLLKHKEFCTHCWSGHSGMISVHLNIMVILWASHVVWPLGSWYSIRTASVPAGRRQKGCSNTWPVQLSRYRL